MNAGSRESFFNGVQAAPSVYAIVSWLAGKDLAFWTALAGLLFIVTQWMYVLWRWRRDARREAARQAEAERLAAEENDDE